ncbi:YlbF family regulator [Bombilactobacillus thymidiniphilus]|uniref:UPF0342 protein MOO47_06065 n=1 Tax=Bombilactobacillus thymidiniphilus TaxID=2923363 RepID=A0ABY4PCF9_9LACO|nr:YlbF family regulator [Bombilactobacillus thymidiniphilus]UQS83339.1 YlbF family regulator [Bombilactobacillus thymidiniphilus]
MVNVYDTANQLEKDLRQSEEVLGLQGAFAKMKADPMAYKLFQQMQQMQEQLQQKQASNQEISDDEIKQLQELSGKLAKFDSVQNLMEQERKINAMMEELNKIISKPIADVYNS